MTQTFIETVQILHCYKCNCAFGMCVDLYQRRRADGKSFWCPNGHGQRFLETSVQRLEKELANEVLRRSRAEESARRSYQDAEHFKKSRNALRGQVTKIKKRVGNGSCPCCSRHFVNLQRHMLTKHPDYKNDNTEDESSNN